MFTCSLLCGEVNDDLVINSHIDTVAEADEVEKYISIHVFNVRNMIRDRIKMNPKMAYANPIKFLIKNRDKKNDKDPVVTEKVIVNKEVMDYAKKLLLRDVQVKDLSFDLKMLNEYTAYRVDDEVIIYKDFVKFLDLVSQMFDRVVVMKPLLCDAYTDEIYLIFGAKTNVEIPKVQIIPRNYELYVDFLYCMYTYGLYVMLLIEDMDSSTSFTKVEHLTITPSDEYRLIVMMYNMKLKELNITSDDVAMLDD